MCCAVYMHFHNSQNGIWDYTDVTDSFVSFLQNHQKRTAIVADEHPWQMPRARCPEKLSHSYLFNHFTDAESSLTKKQYICIFCLVLWSAAGYCGCALLWQILRYVWTCMCTFPVFLRWDWRTGQTENKAVIPESVISPPNRWWRFVCAAWRLVGQLRAFYQLYVWQYWRENTCIVTLQLKQ